MFLQKLVVLGDARLKNIVTSHNSNLKVKIDNIKKEKSCLKIDVYKTNFMVKAKHV
jgi:hypothetical protein